MPGAVSGWTADTGVFLCSGREAQLTAPCRSSFDGQVTRLDREIENYVLVRSHNCEYMDSWPPGGSLTPRPPLPPFTEETAQQKVQAAEDAWNTRDPERVAGGYTEDSAWRNRDEFVTGRTEIVEFLRRKWARELDYALRKELWSFTGNRIAVRFQYESHDAAGQWWRSYGNELWEFTEEGLMSRREASINDVAIDPAQRRIHGPRPEADRGVSFPLR
jgi:nuclear transport factor 2 (NTF2) superfamily protein